MCLPRAFIGTSRNRSRDRELGRLPYGSLMAPMVGRTESSRTGIGCGLV
jgi:hypothetical protein